MKSATPLLLMFCLIGAVPPASAETLLLDAIEQAPPNSQDGIPRPARGTTMAQVRDRFGPPAQELPWVGDPPISRWIYDDFTVYFENEFVIRSVVNR